MHVYEFSYKLIFKVNGYWGLDQTWPKVWPTLFGWVIGRLGPIKGLIHGGSFHIKLNDHDVLIQSVVIKRPSKGQRDHVTNADFRLWAMKEVEWFGWLGLVQLNVMCMPQLATLFETEKWSLWSVLYFQLFCINLTGGSSHVWKLAFFVFDFVIVNESSLSWWLLGRCLYLYRLLVRIIRVSCLSQV